ncbi:MAG: MotA/TolQ/ExbB proton channel family protein [Planctomycetota bacterium]
MLRWLIDSQALPALMWSMVGLSFVIVAGASFLVLTRWSTRALPGERWTRELLELGAELGPMLGILGTVAGLALGFGNVGTSDARALLIASLRTALYSTAVGLVIAKLALVALFLTARRSA